MREPPLPLIEGQCRDRDCPAHPYRQEHFYHHIDSPLNGCDCCGGPTDRLVSTFGIVWTGEITQRYREKGIEGYYAPDGMDVWERKTPDGKPRHRHLNTWSEVRQHCKSEGLHDPRSIGKNCEVSSDGRSASWRGMPGSEV